MTEQVNRYIAFEREQLLAFINQAEAHYDLKKVDESTTYLAIWNEMTKMRAQQWAIRDSLAALYPENDPLREQFIQLWNRKEAEMNQELYPILVNKTK